MYCGSLPISPDSGSMRSAHCTSPLAMLSRISCGSLPEAIALSTTALLNLDREPAGLPGPRLSSSESDLAI